MGYDLKSTKQFLPVNSVLVNTDGTGDDKLRPFLYTDWLDRIGSLNISQESLKGEYNKYVRDWHDRKKIDNDHNYTKKERYKALLKNIALNFTTDEEKRFLTNINYDNPRHLESALTFFSTKLKQISKYYSIERENIKYSTGTKKVTGTKKALVNTIYTEVDSILNRLEITDTFNIDNRDDAKIVVQVVDLYDNIITTNKEYIIDYNQNLYTDFRDAIDDCLGECIPLLQLSEGLVLSVTEQRDNTQENFEQLDYEWFYNYVKEQSNLNIYNEADFIKSLAGTDHYIIDQGNPVKIFDADTPWRDIYSRNKPIINRLRAIESASEYEISFMSLPKNVTTLTYYSYAPQYITTTDSVSAHADMTKFGNSFYTGSSAIGLDHFEDITWLKADSSNDGLFGDIVNSNKLPRFFSYRSENDVRDESSKGISRSTDPMGFFTGHENLEWANEDIFKRKIENIYPLDERQETLLVGDDTVVKWSTDIFGNEYALFKKVESPRDPNVYAAGESAEDFVTDSVCQIIDGGDTLKPRPVLWTKGISHKTYEGGRRGGIDPKIEQRLNMTVFEDLRRFTTVLNPEGVPVQALEPHNTYYLAPDKRHTELVLTKITFHGFQFEDEQPVYDQQAYCGLFTDETCGRLEGSQRQCVVRDNYAFGIFSDIRSTVDTHAVATHDNSTYYVRAAEPGIDKSDWSIVINPSQPETSLTFDGSVFTANFEKSQIAGAELVKLLNTSEHLVAYGGQTNTAATAARDSMQFWSGLKDSTKTFWSRRVFLTNPLSGYTETTILGNGLSSISELADEAGLIVSPYWVGGLDQVVQDEWEITLKGGTEYIPADDSITSTTTLQFSGGEETYYISSSEPLTSQTDAFEFYFNTGFARHEEDENYLTFDGNTTLTGIDVWENENIDGSGFGEELCEPSDAEYITNESRVSDYYDYQSNVSRTKFAPVDKDDMIRPLTIYEKMNIEQGRMIFRSVDSFIIDDVINVLSKTLVRIGTPEYAMYDREIVREQLINNKIVDMDVYSDVLVIQTETHMYAEKVVYDGTTRELLRGPYPSLFLKTTTDDNTLETSFSNYYDDKENELICGHTRAKEIDEVLFPQPIILVMNMNNMTTKSLVIPEDQITLTDELSAFHITEIDRPIVTYNELVEVYTLTYTCRLESADQSAHGVCIFDFEKSPSGLTILSSNIYHTQPLIPYESALDPWEEKIVEKTLTFPKDIPLPTTADTNYTIDMQKVFGEVFSGYTFRVTMDIRSIPVDTNGSKINRITFDPGDGSGMVYRHRELQTGLEPINFDIGDLPDQSDFADPRITPFYHEYNFEDSESSTLTATLEVLYANFKKLTIHVVLERQPYSATTAFDKIKLIKTKTYTDKLGKSKQLLTLETQNPTSVSDVVILKDQYVNSTVIGYLNGRRYAGPYHVMSDGSMMTGEIHTPDSKAIIPI